jgi:predicted peroxiredoxin
MTTRDSKLLVMVATGKEDGGKRATLAFSAACCSAAMGARTCVFLVGDGAAWAYEGEAEGVRHDGFPPLAELMSDFLDIGGEALICSACDRVCAAPRETAARRAGFKPAGMTAVLSEMQGASSLTF